jgi:hypothetical protein
MLENQPGAEVSVQEKTRIERVLIRSTFKKCVTVATGMAFRKNKHRHEIKQDLT